MVKLMQEVFIMAEFMTKMANLDRQLANPTIHKQVREVQQIVAYAGHKQVLATAPQKLGFEPDQFEDLLAEIGTEQKQNLQILNHLLNGVRQYLSLRFGIWSLPNLKIAHLLKEKFGINSALEIMAGNAYWSKALSEVGINTIATDSFEWAKTSKTGQTAFYPLENLEASAAIKKYANVDLILCSWSPNFGDSDLEVIKCWQNCSKAHLLFIGEKEGATNSPDFWLKTNFINSEALRTINRSFQSYDFIDEKFYEIERK